MQKDPRDLGLPFSVWTCEELSRYEADQHDHVAVCAETVRRHLRNRDFRIVRPVQSIGSPDPEYEQKACQLQTYQDQARRGEIVLLYEDEVDLDLLPGVIGCWTRRGSQIKVRTPGQNEKRYGYGAVDYVSGRLVRRVEERKRSDGFCALVGQIAAEYPPTCPESKKVGPDSQPPCTGRKVVLVLDNYIIHKSKQTQAMLDQHRSWLEVFYLPTYSPHLNPIEWLWRYLHRRVTHNHLFESVQDLLAAVEQFFAEMSKCPERVLSVIGATAVPENLCGAI